MTSAGARRKQKVESRLVFLPLCHLTEFSFTVSWNQFLVSCILCISSHFTMVCTQRMWARWYFMNVYFQGLGAYRRARGCPQPSKHKYLLYRTFRIRESYCSAGTPKGVMRGDFWEIRSGQMERSQRSRLRGFHIPVNKRRKEDSPLCPLPPTSIVALLSWGGISAVWFHFTEEAAHLGYLWR